ncbi:MAG TPA: hypothetical protein VFK41_11830 [Nocardioidaceae bacterium]|nr:hypothetical protein [Nocardioidaceae bacterium]
MTTTPPAGYCRRCGTPFGIGAATCPSCGLQVSVALAERAAATPVYGAPPVQVPSQEPVQSPVPEAVDAPVILEPDPSYEPQFAAPAPPRRFGLPDRASFRPSALTRSRLTVPGFDPRRTRDIVVGGVLVLALILGGLWTWTYLQNRPVHDALDRAAASYGRLLQALDGASSLKEVRAAAAVATEVADALADTQMDLAGRSGDLADAALDVVSGQHEIAIAAARLGAVSERELGVWGSVEGALASARTQLVDARRELSDVDGDEAARVDDPAAAIDNVRTVVGDSATRVLATSMQTIVDRLGTARRTAQVRDTAADAHAESAVVSAALVGLSGDTAAVVSAIGEALKQVALLQGLDADHLDAWEKAREGVVSSLGVLTEADRMGDRFGDRFGAQATRAVDNLDGLVSAGRVAMRQWEADLARAKRKQARAQRALTAYDDAVAEQLTRYQELRSELAAFLLQVAESDEELDARGVLDSAVEGRTAVLEALEELTPPAALDEVHAGLEDVLRTAVRVVRTAADDLDKAYYCGDCDYAESDSYQTFSDASEQLASDYAEAEAAWRRAVGRLEVRISDKSLPTKPVV